MKDDITTVVGACPQDCPDTCSILFSVKDGKLVGARGNPDHPITQGRLCTKLNDFTAHHHNPDRILYPMKRTGPKGSGEFTRITWDEALSEIRNRWTDIIDTHGAQSILPCSYLGHQGLLNGLNVGDAFFNKLGATVAEKTFCGVGRDIGTQQAIGESTGVDPESLVHSRYIVLWAVNTLSTNSHQWPFLDEARRNGAKIVVIDPTRSRTAAQADWHIRIRPGSDAALALGMMQVIIAEGLVDQDYVDAHTVGFEELAARAAEFTPEKVAEITGIPADDIRTFAREYATTDPAFIRLGVAIERHANGGQAARAISCLPALTGAWKHVGGGYMGLTLSAFAIDWDAVMRPDFIREGTRVINLNGLGDALLEVNDPPVKSLMVYNINPVVQAPDQDRIREGLMREDLFTVCSELFMTDTARYADILLPATMQAEQNDLMFAWGHFYWAYNGAAVAPPGEAVQNTELFRRLAATMGFEEPEWQRSDEELMQDYLLWDDPRLKGITLARLKEEGFIRVSLPDKDHYAPHAEGNFPTPSGKCEFVSSIAANGNYVPGGNRSGYAAFQDGSPVDPLPGYKPMAESPESAPELAARYPLNILSPKAHGFLNSQYANERKQRRREGLPVVIIHPQDAEARGIAEGDAVSVFNDRGRFDGDAMVSDDTIAGVVVSYLGHWANDARKGSSVNAISASRSADLGRAPTYSDNLVEVQKISLG